MNILDVRTSEKERKIINKIIKHDNRIKGSKFIKTTNNGEYNKKQKLNSEDILSTEEAARQFIKQNEDKLDNFVEDNKELLK